MRERGQPGLLAQVRREIRLRQYSQSTEKTYVRWVKQYVKFHDFRHPAKLGQAEATAFLSNLATHREVSASTQNQALSALLFLYRNVLRQDLGWLDGIVRAKRRTRLPVVLTPGEIRAVLARLEGTPRLLAALLYGTGLRLGEALTLRVKDLDFERSEIRVCEPKGGRGRVTVFPSSLAPNLGAHLVRVKSQFDLDLEAAGWNCPGRLPGNRQPRLATGNGSGYFRQLANTTIKKAASADGTTFMRRCCSGQ